MSVSSFLDNQSAAQQAFQAQAQKLLSTEITPGASGLQGLLQNTQIGSGLNAFTGGRGPWMDLLDPTLLKFGSGREGSTHSAPFYAQLLNTEMQPGGALSSLSANQVHAGQVGSILSAERSRGMEGMRGLQQAGASPMMAAAAYGEDPYRAMRAVAPVRAQNQRQLQEDRFNAFGTLTQLLQEADRTSMEAAFGRKGLRQGDQASPFSDLLQLGAVAAATYFGGPAAGAAAGVGTGALGGASGGASSGANFNQQTGTAQSFSYNSPY